MRIRKLRPRLFVCIALFVAACFFGPHLFAQNISTAQLNGTVRDPSGAVVPGAAITISDASKGILRTTTSDGQGNYEVLLLQPGSYTVTASAPGFARTTANDVVLTVGEQATLILTLSIGGSETVNVVAGADLIETQRS